MNSPYNQQNLYGLKSYLRDLQTDLAFASADVRYTKEIVKEIWMMEGIEQMDKDLIFDQLALREIQDTISEVRQNVDSVLNSLKETEQKHIRIQLKGKADD